VAGLSTFFNRRNPRPLRSAQSASCFGVAVVLLLAERSNWRSTAIAKRYSATCERQRIAGRALPRVVPQRIHARKLSGLKLAKQTGFEPAHISNFLNRKRSLSVEGMDRIFAAQGLSVYDLLSREELNKRASSIFGSRGRC
jgi:hypothetical protein